MKSRIVCFFCLFLAHGVAAPAWAGLVTDPAPLLDPTASARVIYFVPGVTKNNDIETLVICTNLEKLNAVTIGVQVYDSDGSGPLNDVSSGVGDGAVKDIPSGGTATIATGATVGFSEDDVISGLPLNVKGGSARVVSTSKKIACGAYLVDELSAPPTSMTRLPIINRKQGGD